MNTPPLNTNMNRNNRSGNLRPFFDTLESRLVLSATGAGQDFDQGSGVQTAVQPQDVNPLPANLTVSGVSVTDGSKFTTAPTSIIVTFDRPIDPGSLSIDFTIMETKDGSTFPIDDTGNYVNETPGEDGMSVILTTQSPLSDVATYTLVMSGYSGLTGLDGSSISPVDQTLTSFMLAPAGVGLNDASDIPLDPTVESNLESSLDFVTNPYDVKLYKIELAQGHHWRLGGTLLTRFDGTHLDGRLAIFDSTGKLIESDSFGNAVSFNANPNATQPYFFVGLNPGKYYIGVSSQANLPYNSAATDTDSPGYDPAGGTPGTADGNQPGGSFTLRLVADPVDSAVTVVASTLNSIDQEANPSGITIQFSGGIDGSSLGTTSDQPLTGLQLVDQSGKAWGLCIADYNQTTASLRLLFTKELPAGHYRLMLPSEGGLVDLAGYHPKGETKDPSVLAEFDISNEPGSYPRTEDGLQNYGLMLPSVYSIGGNLTLNEGQSATVRVAITVPNTQYLIQTQFASGDISIAITDSSGKVYHLDPQRANFPNSIPLTLKEGVYYISFHAEGSGSHELNWRLKYAGVRYDSLYASLVGQDAGLTQRIVAPFTPVQNPPAMNPTGPTASNPQPWSGNSGSTQQPGGNVNSEAPETPTDKANSTQVTPSVVSIPQAWGPYPTSTNSLVGNPLGVAEHVAVVGPTTSNGSISLAYNGVGIPLGFGQPFGQGTGPISKGFDNVPDAPSADVSTGGLLAEVTSQASSASVDDRLLAQSSWAERLGDSMARWLRTRESLSVKDETAPDEDVPGVEPGAAEAGVVQNADLSGPMSAIVATYVVVRYRRAVQSWLDKRKPREERKFPGRPKGIKFGSKRTAKPISEPVY